MLENIVKQKKIITLNFLAKKQCCVNNTTLSSKNIISYN